MLPGEQARSKVKGAAMAWGDLLDVYNEKVLQVIKRASKFPGHNECQKLAEQLGDPYDNIRKFIVDIEKPEIRRALDLLLEMEPDACKRLLESHHFATLFKVMEIR